MRIDIGGNTDQGRVRLSNEDAYGLDEKLNLFVVSDGMGGHAHGEIASRLAVETVLVYCREAGNHRATPPGGESLPGLSAHGNGLTGAVALANRKIHDEAEMYPQLRGMGATIVAAWLNGDTLSVAHVGDSRAYLLRGGTLTQLTADHSLVAERVRRGLMTPQEAETSQLQSVLLRALGIDEDVQVDADELALNERDTLLLCSDGLTRMVTDPEIASTLGTVEPAQAAVNRLIELANGYGGEDNITAIVLRVLPGAEGILTRLRDWVKGSEPESDAGGS